MRRISCEEILLAPKLVSLSTHIQPYWLSVASRSRWAKVNWRSSATSSKRFWESSDCRNVRSAMHNLDIPKTAGTSYISFHGAVPGEVSTPLSPSLSIRSPVAGFRWRPAVRPSSRHPITDCFCLVRTYRGVKARRISTAYWTGRVVLTRPSRPRLSKPNIPAPRSPRIGFISQSMRGKHAPI